MGYHSEVPNPYHSTVIDRAKKIWESADKVARESNLNNLVLDEGLRPDIEEFVHSVEVDGEGYLFCRAPWLDDPDKMTEAGFALKVDELGFRVYPYIYRRVDGKKKVLSKLPQCVHIAYSSDGTRKGVALSAVDSAAFFIYHYLVDLARGEELPLKIFDDKLYQQLVSRLATDPDAGKRIVELRLEYILRGYDRLDPSNPAYEFHLKMANENLLNFLFGCEDNITNEGFIDLIDPKIIMPYFETLYDSLSKDIEKTKSPATKSQIAYRVIHLVTKSQSLPGGPIFPKEDTMQKIYRSLLELSTPHLLLEHHELLYEVRVLATVTGVAPSNEVLQEAYENYIAGGRLDCVKKLKEIFKMEPSHKALQKGYKKYLESTYENSSRIYKDPDREKELKETLKSFVELLGAGPGDRTMHHLYEKFLAEPTDLEYKVKLTKYLIGVSGVAPKRKVLENLYLECMFQPPYGLLGDGPDKTPLVEELAEFCGIDPESLFNIELQ